MLTEYIRAAMKMAHYEYWEDDKVFFGEIPLLEGVITTGTTLEECREELAGVLESWLLISLHKNLPIPEIAGICLEIKEAA